MAITLINMGKDKKERKDREAIVNLLLDAGADISSESCNGTPLALACNIESNHAMRLRLARRILDLGADPNQICSNEMGIQTTPLILVSSKERGCYSESDCLDMMKMLLEFGADPGIVVSLPDRETCTVIHTVVSRRQAQVLECLLSTEKGRAAVDVPRRDFQPTLPGEKSGDGETALIMAVAGPDLNKYKANRECAVLLLKAGANPEIKDSQGISAALWLKDPQKHRELGKLVKKARRQGPSFWDSEEVKAFIGGDDGRRHCPQCLVWSDQKREFVGQKSSGFQRCSRCQKQWYCSRDCQVKHWKTHKKDCRPVA
jgi:ankyrin repeat protein